MIEEIMVEIVN